MYALTLAMGQLSPKMAWWEEKTCKHTPSLLIHSGSEMVGPVGGSTHAL